MIKENRNQVVIPVVSHNKIARAYHKFLKRHGYKTGVEGIKPVRKE